MGFDRGRAAAVKKKRQDETTEWMRAIKAHTGCMDCGYNSHPVALQFDHVNNDKEFTIGSRSSASRVRLQKEMDKCEVVCANCHHIRTHTRTQVKAEESKMLTQDELVEKLVERMDPNDLVDLLQITSEEVMDHFVHKIEELDLYEQLNEELGL